MACGKSRKGSHPNKGRRGFVQCSCCGQRVSPSTARRHQLGQAKPHIKATAMFARSLLSVAGPSHSGRQNDAQESRPSPRSEVPAAQLEFRDSADSGDFDLVSAGDENFAGSTHGDDSMLGDNFEFEDGADSFGAIHSTLEKVQNSRRPNLSATVESDDDDEDFGIAGDSSDSDGWTSESEEEEGDISGLSAWDALGQSFEQDVVEMAEQISDDDLAVLRAFALKVRSYMSAKTFAMLPYAFPHSPPPSLRATRTRVSALSGVDPVLYDCCVNSCCCFVGPHANETLCPFCQEPRYDAHQKGRSHFTYIPLIPRLTALYRNSEISQKMQYRSEHHFQPDIVTDIFDGSVYRNLLDRYVQLDGKTTPHQYFSDPRDIALGLATDGFAPFRRRKTTAWPIIIHNFNLPPEIRFHRQYTICLGVVPGPKKPKDFDSFLWPAVEEFLKLALGVRAYDALRRELFALRAYLIVVSGDIPALSMVIRMKGHNGFSPCRMCKITGLRVPNSRAKTLYVPLHRSHHPDVQQSQTAIKQYDSANLPMRTHNEILEQGRQVERAATNTEAERLAKEYGVKGVPVLSVVPSIALPLSFPYDFMHLIFENLIPNLILMWTNDFKDLGEGSQSFTFLPTVWEAVGSATASSGPTLPYSFCSRPQNIATYEKSQCTADSWSFWTQYIAPVVLERRFREQKYYTHFLEFVRLIRCCLQFEISREDVRMIRRGFEHWVEKYEEYYYQYSPARLAACPVTIHALLHIADSIDATGPVWTSWAFPMERFCGSLQPAIKSRRHPYASIDRHVVDEARLTQVQLLYNLQSMLTLTKPPSTLAEQSFSHEDYPSCVLIPPRSSALLEASLVRKVINSLATRYDTTASQIRDICSPQSIEEWGKVRRLQGGDTMHAAALVKRSEDSRDATYVRYETLVDKYARQKRRRPEYELKTFFGRLQHIFVVRLPPTQHLNIHTPAVHILAGIETCEIQRSTDLDIHYFNKVGSLDVVDISCVQCLVGRIPVASGWAIVDRSGDLARALYAADEPLNE
ncbi:hypothetical protein HYDPIDRAFT_184816 [Hydnomerulius pinastri MD-312]|nr:hypothetical protein HYDPIDRAFT_184816 [Hydnomerulius pinastri MD-312]